MIFIIFATLSVAPVSSAAVDTGISKVDSSLKIGAKSPVDIATTIINFLLGFLALAALGLMLWAGFLWMTAGGNEDKIAQAKKILRNGVIGLVIILSAWGIVYYVLTNVLNLTGNSNSGTYCSDGSRISCGCGGEQVCRGNSWSACENSTCHPEVTGNVSCDGNNILGGCQADANLCGPDYLCNESCVCEPKKELGQSCDSNPDGSCQADNNLCGPYLKCDPNSCVCSGPPVITGISPVGGFCNNDENRACNNDSDCLSGGICNLSSPNGAANNFLTIYGYNFNSSLKTNEQLVVKNDFSQTAVGSLPSNWQAEVKAGVKLSVSSVTAKSDKNSLLIHQDKDQPYPGKCSQAQCASMSGCSWNNNDKTCSFSSKDECKKTAPAVYTEGESLCYPNANSNMEVKLSYNLTPLNLKLGETYSIQFYYKGRISSNLSLSVGDKKCLGYDKVEALKAEYSWNGSAVSPAPRSGDDPCRVSYGLSCSEQSNTCCANAPYQKKCYAAESMTPINYGTYNDWTLYSYSFQYTPEMESWVNKSGQKTVEFIISSALQGSNAGMDLYIDDFSVVKMSESGRVVFLGKDGAQEQVANYPKTINPSCISSWTNRQIIIAIPSGAASGPIKVEREDASASQTDQTDDAVGPKIPDFVKNNISRPGLCSISPTRGLLGDKVVYQGVNLRNGEAYFGDYSNPYKGINSNFTDNSLSGQTLAPSIMPGKVSTFVEAASLGTKQKSNTLLFIKDSDPEMGPYISSFSPVSGPAGQYITITGKGFGNSRGSREVFFGEKQAVYDFPEVCANSVWRDDQIVVKVPEGLGAGSYPIKINLGDSVITSDLLSPSTFKYDPTISLKTGICKIDPALGQVGTDVSLWGEYFGSVGTNASVVFNSDKSTSSAIKKDGKADKIETRVPAEAISGPVHVLKNGEWGNQANFSVGKCTSDAQCGSSSPVCCQGNTYKSGSCAASLVSCYFDVPNSVYETSFNTGYNSATSTSFDSCAGMAAYFGSCQTGQFCPNSPGKCSPYSPQIKVVGSCGTTFECGKIPYCAGGSNNCTYNKDKDVCVANSCQLEKEMDYSLIDSNGKPTNYKGLLSCRDYNGSLVKHLSVKTTCPNGWIKTVDGLCASSIPCGNCPGEFSCKDDGDNDDTGKCESSELCASSAYCGQNPGNLNQYACLDTEKKSCDCCCEIGKDAECCAPLKCAGTCGSDQTDDGEGYGSCSGCATVGNTPDEHDAACNCSTTSGKFCKIDSKNPQGTCVDCAALDQIGCAMHSDVCCFDASKKVCQGGDGRLVGGGYCAFYDCDNSDKSKCNLNPSTSGRFLATSTCATTCASDPQDVCDKAGTNAAECSKIDKCCFDGKTCVAGSAMPSAPLGNSIKYCARYDCVKGSANSCKIPSLTGAYISTTTCSAACENQANPGASCASDESDSCNLSVCGNPYSCLNTSGTPAGNGDCGFCCCTPGTKTESGLTCVADKGNCKGSARGLFCGCSADKECGAADTQGCGQDTCCHDRPDIVSTSPADISKSESSKNVCRNAQISINFNQLMNIDSLSSNILLIEERDYGQGVCPAGTSMVGNTIVSVNNNLFNRIFRLVRGFWTSSDKAIAAAPSADKLYCINPAVITAGQNFYGGATTTVAYIKPSKPMSAAANYFVVVKGDKDLDSNTGVMSEYKVGLNPQDSPIKDANGITFNKATFYNSYIFSFRTLDARGQNKGLCTVNSVEVKPSSFLIKTAENNSSDDNPLNANFNKENDSDRLLTAYAYSVDNQLLQPVSAYFWNWNWTIENNNVASKVDISGLDGDKIVVRAKDGVTDSATKVIAAIDMVNFSSAGNCNSNNCSCADSACSAKCCNATLEGDRINNFSDMYVFMCNNPWPMEKNGTWSPWFDISKDKDGKDVVNHNYKFYYCRDAGGAGTADDLPAINDSALIFGANSNFVCSEGGTVCPAQGAACGPNNNGVCVWSVLKESFFFRESIPQTGEISNASDTGLGGQVQLDWYSPSALTASYKIYYSSAQGNSSTTVVPVALNNCTAQTGRYMCSFKVSGLTNGQKYNFRVSSVSDKKAESLLSGIREATPTDKTPAATPSEARADIVGAAIRVSWKPNTDDAVKYRIYHGVASKRYGESFDSALKASSFNFRADSYNTGEHFFAVSSLDPYGNESAKSNEAMVTISR